MATVELLKERTSHRHGHGLSAGREAADDATALDHAASPRIVYYEGERIYFRPVELEDEPLLRRWINEPRNWRGLVFRPPVNARHEREWIESVGKPCTEAAVVFGVVVRDSDRLIGTAGLHHIDQVTRSAEFGINIGEVAYQNKGYGTEATKLTIQFGFEELNLNRIGLSVSGNNTRAIRCYQKAGFVPEGCLRQAAYRNGQYHDVYRFAILRSEWSV